MGLNSMKKKLDQMVADKSRDDAIIRKLELEMHELYELNGMFLTEKLSDDALIRKLEEEINELNGSYLL